MTQISIRGNMTAQVEVRYTQSGKAVGNVTVAVNRGRDDNKQTDFYRVTLWESLAENAAQLDKGTSVIVIGRMESRDYDDRDGNKRTAWEVTADAFGPDLRFQTAQVTRTAAGGPQARAGQPQTASTGAGEPWSVSGAQTGWGGVDADTPF